MGFLRLFRKKEQGREREKDNARKKPLLRERVKNIILKNSADLVLPLCLLVGSRHRLEKQPPRRGQARQGEQGQDRGVQRARGGQDAEDGVFVDKLKDRANGGDGDEG